MSAATANGYLSWMIARQRLCTQGFWPAFSKLPDQDPDVRGSRSYTQLADVALMWKCLCEEQQRSHDREWGAADKKPLTKKYQQGEKGTLSSAGPWKREMCRWDRRIIRSSSVSLFVALCIGVGPSSGDSLVWPGLSGFA